MPRRPRIFLPGIPLHLIQRGNNRQACFFADDDYRANMEFKGTEGLSFDQFEEIEGRHGGKLRQISRDRPTKKEN